MGKPIIAAVEGDTAEILKQIGAGIVCQPENPFALAESVRTLHLLNDSERKQIGNRGRDVFIKYFSRQVLINEYETLFQKILRK